MITGSRSLKASARAVTVKVTGWGGPPPHGLWLQAARTTENPVSAVTRRNMDLPPHRAPPGHSSVWTQQARLWRGSRKFRAPEGVVSRQMIRLRIGGTIELTAGPAIWTDRK